MFTVQHLLLDELPQSLNQVQIGRIGGQELQIDLQAPGQVHYYSTMLIAGIVQHQGYRPFQTEGRDLLKQQTHGVSGHRAGRCDADQFPRHCIPGAQYAVALPPRTAANEQANQTPDAAQEGSFDEMGCVHKEYMALTGPRFVQQRFQGAF